MDSSRNTTAAGGDNAVHPAGGDTVQRLRIGELRHTLANNPHDRDVAPSPLPTWLQRILVAVFIVLVVISFVFMVVHRWRRGTVLLGASMLYLALLRWVVDSRLMGVLSVRSRRFDSLFAGSLGAAMLWLAFSIDSLNA